MSQILNWHFLQNLELLVTSKKYSFGFDSIIGYYGQDQSCLKIRNTNLDYDKIVNDQQLLQQHLLEFKQKLSSSLNISTDQIEILGVSKGNFEISFNILGNDMKSISQQIQNNPEAKKFLNEYCNGNVEYVAYFDQANIQSKGVTLSFDDFKSFTQYEFGQLSRKKEQRGPPYHRYDYYFPIGCYGFGLNVEKQVKQYGNDWLKTDGNPNEWRIMYYGTKQAAVNQILRNNLIAGGAQDYQNTECIDEFGNKVKVGRGIYFSDRLSVSKGYKNPVQTGNKKFSVYFMSRVNPRKLDKVRA
ncbi:unnamed protein product (macronuclear) [Paramecium tetraurelia]|uniref:PARP catalytic domain-containing protein n=1 Tax=Paramecium tetraurelia TaxID=5888 RepID=A0DW86_PARTE|nr:uncharacterized protein GSPATT00039806001 [Paramecium tetraurelia]CAK87303.1 unnamed protein product [Paramecium tetraurelia]|eukprot:XP_001454700.1 hypothetical protein (macronuclear) [Paramecium tetraurelia strain d4-2]